VDWITFLSCRWSRDRQWSDTGPYPPISDPKGPSALDLPGLTCAALTLDEVRALPSEFSRTARLAKEVGFGGVQVHAAHGFLLSQFLSPLFNRRDDDYGGSIASRARLLLEILDEVRSAVGPNFPVAVKLNATDQLEGGLDEQDALTVVAALDGTGVDLIDISGGTYFPGARSASDSAGSGPYFVDFAKRARTLTNKPLMVTGGFKTLQQAVDTVAGGDVDVVGLARALEPALPNGWQHSTMGDPVFPSFIDPPEGGITVWYTMRLTGLGEERELSDATRLEMAIAEYEDRIALWKARFSA